MNPNQQDQHVNRFSSGGGHLLIIDQDMCKARRSMQSKIYEFLKCRQQSQELPEPRMLDIVRRLEEGLFNTATTKEEYMNMETLKTRLHGLIRRVSMMINRNQQDQHVNRFLSGGGHQFNIDQDMCKAHRSMQSKIYEFLKRGQRSQELPEPKMLDIVRRLDEGLFKTATTKEEYMNLETLETRLHGLIKRLPMMINLNEQDQRVNQLEIQVKEVNL